MKIEDKKLALVKHLKTEGDNYTIEDITEEDMDTLRIIGSSWEYLVLTDEEADKYAKEYINETIWAFNTDFIIAHSSILDYDDGSKAIIEAIQEQCEGGNEAMKKLIDNFDEFVDDAISADGRGHFINSYDGNEYSETVNGTEYYIYRIN